MSIESVTAVRLSGSIFLAGILLFLAAFLLSSSYAENALGKAEKRSVVGLFKKTDDSPTMESRHGRYVCPMHPQQSSHEAGKCNLCGMFLVRQDTQKGASVHDQQIPMNASMAGTHDHANTDHSHATHEEIDPLPTIAEEGFTDGELYICPMHPQEVSHVAGKCSICGMFLESMDSGEAMSSEHDPVVSQSKQHRGMARQTGTDKILFWENSDLRSGRDPTRSVSHADADDSSVNSASFDDPPPLSTSHPPAAQGGHDHKHLTSANDTHGNAAYICPMHAQISQDHPGSCPICGMDLVTRTQSRSDAGDPQVFLSAAVMQNMGVRRSRVQREYLTRQIRTQGVVTPDDDRILSVHPRTGGWIEVLHLITEGDRVERKEVLVDFYSPWINEVQLDYISALEEFDMTSFDPSRKAEISAKVDSLQNSLRLLKVMDMDIMRIKNSRKVQNTIQLMAPQGGIVTRLNVREGTYVEPYQSMFTIVDLSQVWVMVDIYEHQAPWVRKGQKVDITAPAIPGRTWQGVVDFIYPEVDIKTRTLRARITVANPDEALLLNMFVQVAITNTTEEPVLLVPRQAVILTGERETVVKALGKGHFQPVDVRTGLKGENGIEIISGLNEEDEIVVSGQFLIDSESNLQAGFLRMAD